MKFITGEIPTDENFNPEQDKWKPFKEPNPVLTQIIALPIGMLSVLLIYYLAVELTMFHGFNMSQLGNLKEILLFLLAFVIITPVHELIHALSFPKERPDQIVIGFWPKRLTFFAHYNGPMTRNRFIKVLLAPFLILSVLPIIVMSVLGIANEFIIRVSLANTFAAYVDIFGAIMIFVQVSKSVYIRNNGWRSYWKSIK